MQEILILNGNTFSRKNARSNFYSVLCLKFKKRVNFRDLIASDLETIFKSSRSKVHLNNSDEIPSDKEYKIIKVENFRKVLHNSEKNKFSNVVYRTDSNIPKLNNFEDSVSSLLNLRRSSELNINSDKLLKTNLYK